MILFCPTTYEVPRQYKSHVRIFGMGVKRAQQLALELNSAQHSKPIVVFGSAGALNPKLNPGDFFRIERISFDSKSFEIPNHFNIPLKPASLLTSHQLVPTAKEKQNLYQRYGSDLVDMEMGALWQLASEETRKQFVFVRTVIDDAGSDLPAFLSNNIWKTLNLFQTTKDFLGLIKKWKSYTTGCKQALKYFDDTAHQPHKELL